MAPETSARTKTQTLSLRLDPKTRFILEFMSRVRGQSITMVVERAIKEESERLGIGPSHDHNNEEIYQSKWSDFWDPDEGMRSLKLFASPHYPTNYDEDEIRSFTVAHWQFFYSASDGQTPLRPWVSVLWPQIDKYLKTWRDTKAQDYWAAGKQMATDLSQAKLKPPDWPRQPKQPEPKKATAFSRDLDDEVPF